MLQAYFDESGIHDGAKVCVVGGFYGHQRAWRKFEQQWSLILTDYPELENRGFHAKEFFGRKERKRVGAYENWTDDRAGKFLERLVQAIMRNDITPIVFGVFVKDFLEMPLVSRQWLTGARFRKLDRKCISSGCPSRSYYLPFQFCVLGSARLSGANAVDKIHFFAGLDKNFYKYATELYKFLLEDERLDESLRSLLGGIEYPLSKDTPGIQAADLLVNRLYRYALARLEDENKPVPLLLSQLVKKCRPELKMHNF
jgi:hypothetical protein